jgi:murein L,D-transpeptidase YcbB/YkuD
VVAERLQTIAMGGTLADLRWPTFTDYRQDVQRLYQGRNYAPVWVRNGQATPQALAVVAVLESSQKKGLNPEDYDASRWPQRLNLLKAGPQNADTVVRFDAALTVSAMRYISDLHIGRVNPKHSAFGIAIEQKKYDLPQFLAQKVVAANDVPKILSELEPQYNGYKRTEAALQTYLVLEARDHTEALPGVKKTLAASGHYAAVGPLARRLRSQGDLPQATFVNTKSGIYGGALVGAVKHFQTRHGLRGDGRLSEETLRQLNTPVSDRVLQLEDALEKWRWLPSSYPQLPVLVNIPEFALRVFSSDQHVAMRMNVVVGKELGDQTPVFAKDMKYIVFRPYWNVPLSITRAEIIPALQKNGKYLAGKNLEVTDQNGQVVTKGAVSADMLAQMGSGKLLVRQRPGPTNSLGLVKFLFPNEYDVYLHSTPAQELFSQTRRDFSHGCIRVEKPVDLAAWLLRDQPKWTRKSVTAAMQSGPDNQQVNLTRPVPVVIVYMTAVVDEGGEVYFFDDIYGRDRSMNTKLAKGQPYR